MPGPWTYRPWARDSAIELGQLEAAQAVALACHLHADVQVAAVRKGWRMYMTTFGEFLAISGDIVVIPAGVPHASHGGAGSIVNHLYLPGDHAAVRGISEPFYIRNSRATLPEEMLDAIGSHDPCPGRLTLPAKRAALRELVSCDDLDIRTIAARQGRSTDGFIRQFKREIGMTPAAYRLALRLAAARSRLKCGDTVADVAYAGSFSDQSHLGRLFRRAYGATPAAYRCAFAD
ncbi:helix-turn-helix transcriptional regulator [Bradyrhizobium sp. 160]|uniref:helix-turn-helix domain-containing protein n=1 Tax=unclassified Bradyrhizobium TaxID=2631580 RepID=UPI001FF89E9A|nr:MULTISPECIES: AraC family transcriptional regulator [unclassified Bradyrhizobium]MCK1543984.1 helix-turn-helix transcriptional regulator [Bradyrhizobium sp. 179]MCK1627911.1 helix-turn-helix transcriptional regulator [Bradyrhizobium sp. 160]